MTMKFFAAGVPRPKGNHIALCPRRKAFHRGHTTPCRPFVTEDIRSDTGRKVAAWEQSVRVASREVAPPTPITGPVEVRYTFRLPQPKCHAKEARPPFSKGDWEKVSRAVSDALQAECGGYLIQDDKQIVEAHVSIQWADERGPGVEVEVTALEAQQGRLFR